MVMTTPRDDIAGLSEELRLYAKTEMPFPPDDICSKAATQLDSLLKERDALQARVKELEARQADDLAEFGLMEMRALRAEQERDEAYERLKPFAEASDSLDESHLDRMDLWESPSAMDITAGHLRAARDLVRRLAGPEKEKKE